MQVGLHNGEAQEDFGPDISDAFRITTPARDPTQHIYIYIERERDVCIGAQMYLNLLYIRLYVFYVCACICLAVFSVISRIKIS